MMNANYLTKFSLWTVVLSLLGLILLALPYGDTFSATQNGNVKFDHVRTGFPLTGAHATLPCETCHIQGIFKGTPKKCETCHTQGSRIQTITFKLTNHIVTTQTCDQCHRSTAAWNVATFSHVGVIPHQCTQCHNGAIVMGKPATHIPTNAPCDTCHRTTTWMSAGFDHTGVIPGTCSTCHVQGGSGMAKPTNHIPTNLSCDACHSTGGTFATSTFTHSSTQGVLPGQCTTSGCHSGSYTAWNALGKPAGHVSTTASCDSCHTTGYTSFAGAGFNHTGVAPGTCSTCHYSGGPGLAAPTNHIPYASQLLAGASLNCDACHKSTTSFTAEIMNHNNSLGNGAGWCKGCHASGTSYLGSMQKMSVTHQSSSATDCSQSGCHKPLGSKGSTYSSWN